ncbi:MAG TPA: hemerythrin domain-containing protein [Vicinamibacteria bacterium]|nr:hemerythrin domain-containing protein [Vicinamibacteria bacterium]
MQKAIEVLMNEHRLIEQALGSLETYAGEVQGGIVPTRDVIGEYAAFFAGFADGCHHGKEEDILFQRMVERGFPREAGPLAVMYHEHELGRAQVRALKDIAARPGMIAAADGDALVTIAGSYVPLLRQHILKEDRILYPMALQVLTGPELDDMNTQFEAFEAGMRADGTYDGLQSLAERLTARFRPDPARLEMASRMGCGA